MPWPLTTAVFASFRAADIGDDLKSEIKAFVHTSRVAFHPDRLGQSWSRARIDRSLYVLLIFMEFAYGFLVGKKYGMTKTLPRQKLTLSMVLAGKWRNRDLTKKTVYYSRFRRLLKAFIIYMKDTLQFNWERVDMFIGALVGPVLSVSISLDKKTELKQPPPRPVATSGGYSVFELNKLMMIHKPQRESGFKQLPRSELPMSDPVGSERFLTMSFEEQKIKNALDRNSSSFGTNKRNKREFIVAGRLKNRPMTWRGLHLSILARARQQTRPLAQREQSWHPKEAELTVGYVDCLSVARAWATLLEPRLLYYTNLSPNKTGFFSQSEALVLMRVVAALLFTLVPQSRSSVYRQLEFGTTLLEAKDGGRYWINLGLPLRAASSHKMASRYNTSFTLLSLPPHLTPWLRALRNVNRKVWSSTAVFPASSAAFFLDPQNPFLASSASPQNNDGLDFPSRLVLHDLEFVWKAHSKKHTPFLTPDQLSAMWLPAFNKSISITRAKLGRSSTLSVQDAPGVELFHFRKLSETWLREIFLNDNLEVANKQVAQLIPIAQGMKNVMLQTAASVMAHTIKVVEMYYEDPRIWIPRILTGYRVTFNFQEHAVGALNTQLFTDRKWTRSVRRTLELIGQESPIIEPETVDDAAVVDPEETILDK